MSDGFCRRPVRLGLRVEVRIDVFAMPQVVGNDRVDVGQRQGRVFVDDAFRRGSVLERPQHCFERDVAGAHAKCATNFANGRRFCRDRKGHGVNVTRKDCTDELHP